MDWLKEVIQNAEVKALTSKQIMDYKALGFPDNNKIIPICCTNTEYTNIPSYILKIEEAVLAKILKNNINSIIDSKQTDYISLPVVIEMLRPLESENFYIDIYTGYKKPNENIKLNPRVFDGFIISIYGYLNAVIKIRRSSGSLDEIFKTMFGD